MTGFCKRCGEDDPSVSLTADSSPCAGEPLENGLPRARGALAMTSFFASYAMDVHKMFRKVYAFPV